MPGPDTGPRPGCWETLDYAMGCKTAESWSLSDMGRYACPMQYVGGLLTPHSEGPSWEANSSSANQEIPRFIWKPKVHYRMHKNLSLVWFTVHAIPFSVKIHSNIILPCTRSAYELSFSCRIPTKTVYTFHSSLILAISPASLILLRFFFRVPLDVRYKSRWSSSLCGFLQYHLTTSSLVGSYFFLSTLLSGTVCLCSSLNWKDIRQNCNSVYLSGDVLTSQKGTQKIMDITVAVFPEYNLILSLHTLLWYG